jgi:hypothetical protein
MRGPLLPIIEDKTTGGKGSMLCFSTTNALFSQTLQKVSGNRNPRKGLELLLSKMKYHREEINFSTLENSSKLLMSLGQRQINR